MADALLTPHPAPDRSRSPSPPAPPPAGGAVGLPRHVEVETSRYCNRRCSWCPNGEHPIRRRQELLDWALFAGLLRELSELGYAGWLAFHNSYEPLLNPRLFEELDAVQAMLPAARPAIFTNGDVLTADRLSELVVRGVRYVRVTRYPHRADTPPSSGSINLWVSRAGLGHLRWRHRPVRQGMAASTVYAGTRVEVISPNILGTYNNRGGSVTALPYLAVRRAEPCWMTATTAAIDYRGQFKMCCCVYPEPGSGHDQYVVGSLRAASFGALWWSAQMGRYRAAHAVADWSGSPACATCRQPLPETRQ